MSLAVNKVIVDGVTKIDLTADTAVEADVASGKTFHKADGTIGTGTATSASKYGATVGSFLGNTSSGVLQRPTSTTNYVFTGVREVDQYVLQYRFYYDKKVGSVNFPNLASLNNYYSMSSAYQGSSITSLSMPNLTTISGMQNMYHSCRTATSLTSVSMPSLDTVSASMGLYEAFNQCSALTSVDLSGLRTISGYGAMYNAFCQCTALQSVNLSTLFDVNSQNGMYQTFYSCTNLSSVDLSSLIQLGGAQCMYACFKNTALTSVEFTSLQLVKQSQVLGNAFQNCTSLTSVSFPALHDLSFGTYTNQFNNMLSGCTGVTVHFPADIESVIGNWADVVNGFGGINTTVLFDLQ